MIIVPSAYLAPVSYYALIAAHGREIFIEQHERYIKQTLRNRAVIATEAGKMTLSIPVEHSAGKVLMRDIRISDHGNWRHLHWQALQSAYDRSPFFEYYADDFRPFYEDNAPRFLLDFNLRLQQTVCELLNLEWTPQLTDTYQETEQGKDFRNAKIGGFIEEISQPYYQVFADRHGFLADLSIVDLLFNMGPEALLVLRDMQHGADDKPKLAF